MYQDFWRYIVILCYLIKIFLSQIKRENFGSYEPISIVKKGVLVISKKVFTLNSCRLRDTVSKSYIYLISITVIMILHLAEVLESP